MGTSEAHGSCWSLPLTSGSIAWPGCPPYITQARHRGGPTKGALCPEPSTSSSPILRVAPTPGNSEELRYLVWGRAQPAAGRGARQLSPRVHSGPGLGERALQALGPRTVGTSRQEAHGHASSRRLSSSKLAQAVLCPHVPGWVARTRPLTSQPWAAGRSPCPSSPGWGGRPIPESLLACGLIPSFPEDGSAVLGQGPPLSLARPWLGPHQRVRAWPGPSRGRGHDGNTEHGAQEGSGDPAGLRSAAPQQVGARLLGPLWSNGGHRGFLPA